ncbi:prepilin-type N-terminal cleavage/methylation domain-containing protein [Bacillus infantis]|uniref:Prepilin-type N-terminal cleavage/methylation domain-containing protein n=1 Tax=Bacillus infantis TaxID=324767 RepID=A0A5D4SS04_9BACI|nr:prepilin-type N-terminal cleavage/methylation domain-containing protein [Bacillus infantis]TYS66147.1 prepilin-type N-terminal cleavage/methylation domain-containing protein [Bacillus infantis]
MIKKLGQRLKNEKGLTLIELLAVIVILGIIAAIAIPSIGGIIQKSKEDAVKADAIQVINGAKLYVAANGVPKAGETLKAAELESYVDKPKLKEDYSVEVTTTGDKTDFTITATAEAGNITITFTKATIKHINDAKKGQKAIPAT